MRCVILSVLQKAIWLPCYWMLQDNYKQLLIRASRHFKNPLVNCMCLSGCKMSVTVGGGVSPQLNQFEQVSSDCHQMSLAREEEVSMGLEGGPMSNV